MFPKKVFRKTQMKGEIKDIKIEKLTLENLNEFFEVFKEVLGTGFPEYSKELINFFIYKDFSKNIFSEKIKKNQWLGLLTKFKNNIIGFLVTDKLYGGVSYCLWLGVKKEFQEKGIGSRLLKEWEREIKKQGGHKLMLVTQHKKNKKFYVKNGFKNEGFEEKSWFGLDCWKYGKIIGKPKPEVLFK